MTTGTIDVTFEKAVGAFLERLRTGTAGEYKATASELAAGLSAEGRERAVQAGILCRAFETAEHERERQRAAEREREQIMIAEAAGEHIPCVEPGCNAGIVSIERYHTTIVWQKEPDGDWACGAVDRGTHFHLFCSQGHESKAWGNELPRALKSIVYPGGSR